MTKIFKNLQLKKIGYFLIKNCSLFIPWPRDGQAAGEALNSQKEHPALKNKKILYFFYICRSFLPSWIRIQKLKLMRIQIRIHNPVIQRVQFLQIA